MSHIYDGACKCSGCQAIRKGWKSPVPTDTPLEAACAALKARARINCPMCRWRASGITGDEVFPHTCHGDIKAAKEVALAVYRLVLHEWDGNEAYNTIVRLLPEEAK